MAYNFRESHLHPKITIKTTFLAAHDLTGVLPSVTVDGPHLSKATLFNGLIEDSHE